MPGGIVRIPVVPDTRDFPRQLGDGLRSSAGAAGIAARAIGLAVAGGIVAGAVGIGAAIKLGNEYTGTLNELQAVSGATGAQMVAVGNAARALGSDLTLPATSGADAAAVMLELAKGGFSLQESMDAARGTIQLAAAAQIEGAEAAEIQANAINQFQLAATDASRVADVLANTSNAASGSIQDVALALKYVGPVAQSVGISIEDTATAVGLLAQNGILADSAGTALRGIIASLSAPSKEAAGAIADLGIQAFDQQGRFTGLREVIAQLTAAQGRMTDEQFASAAATAFGREPLAAITALAAGGAQAFDDMSDAVGRQGGAADVAAAKTQGLGGAMDKLQSQAEDAALGVYEAIDGPLEQLVLSMADRTAAFGDSVARGLETSIAVAEVYGPRLSQAISARVDVVQDAVRSVLAPLGEGAVPILNEALNSGIGLWNDFTDVLGDFVDGARPVAEGVRDVAQAATEGGGAVSVLALGIGAVGDAAAFAGDGLGVVGDVLGGVLTTFAELPGPVQAAVLGLIAYRVAASRLSDTNMLAGTRQFSGEMRVQAALAQANGAGISRLDAALAAYRTSQLPAVAAARSFTDVVAALRREAESAGRPIGVVSGALGALAERSPTVGAMASAYQRAFDTISQGSERAALAAGVATEQLGTNLAVGANRAALEVENAGRRVSGFGESMRSTFDSAREAVASRAAAIVSAVQAIPTGVGVAALTVQDRVRGMVSSVGDAVSSLPGRLAALPTAIGVGVVGALDRVPGAVTGAVSSLGQLGAVAGGAAAAGVRGLGIAASGLIGALGGPWGVAIAAAGVGLSLLAGRHADAAAEAAAQAAAVDALAAALRESNGEITEQVRLKVAERFLGDGYTEAADAARKLRINIGDITDAALNQGTALSDLRNRLQELITANTQLSSYNPYAPGQQRDQMNETGQAAKSLLDALNDLAGETADAEQKNRDLEQAIREGRASMLDGTDAGRSFGAAMGVLSERTSSADEKARALKDALDALSGGSVNLEAAQSRVNEQVARLADLFGQGIDKTKGWGTEVNNAGAALIDASGKINTTTDNGRRLFDTLQDLSTGAAEVATKTFEMARANGDDVPAAMQKAAQSVQATRDSLIAQAGQWGLTGAEVEKVLDRYGLVPSEIATLISQPGMDRAQLELLLLQAKVEQVPGTKSITVSTLSDEAVARLEAVGIKVRDVPGGKEIYVDANDADFNKKIADATAPATKTITLAYRDPGMPAAPGVGRPNFPAALGAVLTPYAAGGVHPLTPMPAGIAAVVPANTWRVIGDRPKGDEFYLPDDDSPRSMAIGMEWVRRRGLHVVQAFATGGVATGSAGVPAVPVASLNGARITGNLTINGLDGYIDARVEQADHAIGTQISYGKR